MNASGEDNDIADDASNAVNLTSPSFPLHASPRHYPTDAHDFHKPLFSAQHIDSGSSANKGEDNMDPLNNASKWMIKLTSKLMRGIARLLEPIGMFIDTVESMIERFVHSGKRQHQQFATIFYQHSVNSVNLKALND
uniref:PI3K/PI4K domain-containing protein n=1 Tax=Steinernema glaseri TaxID=37863 RepID=A0A1I8ANI9_9BILA